MTLKKYLLTLVVLDVLWAALLATFGGSLLTEIGGLPAGSLTTVSGWLIIFFAALFQGGVFAIVFSVFGAIMLLVASKSPPIVGKSMLVGVGLAAVWGVIVATFGAGVFDAATAGSGLDAAMSVVLLWIVAFVAGFLQGMIYLVVITVFLGVALFLYAMLTRDKNKDKNDGGYRPNLGDRNPGEPPHR